MTNCHQLNLKLFDGKKANRELGNNFICKRRHGVDNQNQLAELFDTSVPNISIHISNILKEKELSGDSVVKDFLTTAADSKQYNLNALINNRK